MADESAPAKPTGSSFVKAFAARSKKDVVLPTPEATSNLPLWGGQGEEPPPPSLDIARERAASRLPRDPTTGENLSLNGPRLANFEFLGLGVYSYIAHLHRLRFFFMLLSIMSFSSLVANGYGGQLTDKQLNLVTWLFTGASLGNAKEVAPSYGATELLLSTLMTAFLFYCAASVKEDAHRVEQKQVTTADFTVMVTGLPRDLPAAPIQRALEEAPEVRVLHEGVIVPLHQRELILTKRELDANTAKREAYTTDMDALLAARQRNGTLSAAGGTRLDKLKKALADADGARQALLAKAKELVGQFEAGGPKCAGVAFVTFTDAHDAIALLDQGEIALPTIGSHPFSVERPPEPSDVIWENLGSTDGLSRQLQGTCYMTVLSLGGALLIGASAYLQPKATESNGGGAAGDLGVMAVGTLVLLAGYLVVFITVPIVEVSFMRHVSVTQKEVSQVLKLVVFQIMATLSTIGSFAFDTAGTFNRDWYITGGFMLVNGMMVDLFVITCVIQGWGLMPNVGRLVLAPRALTQMEMDAFYLGDGANMYVVDRLQMVTKFVCMCYICSAAIPLLHFVILLVLVLSIAIDETNLLRRLHPAPQSDEAVVKCIVVFVMPLAVLSHLAAAHLFFSDLRAPSPQESWGNISWRTWETVTEEGVSFGLGSEADDGLDFVGWSTWLNAPIVLFFIVREWYRFNRKQTVGAASSSSPPGSGSPLRARESHPDRLRVPSPAPTPADTLDPRRRCSRWPSDRWLCVVFSRVGRTQ